uniref:Uracil-DNA glycosylase n=1 Tax=Callorhinchus milii TaxID=7868 RepID=V9KQE9_CALMI
MPTMPCLLAFPTLPSTSCRLFKTLQLMSSPALVYKKLQSDIEGFEHPGHGNLTGWAKQSPVAVECSADDPRQHNERD